MILQNNLPSKFHLGLHNFLKPDKYSTLFDIINFLINVRKSKGKEGDLTDLKFTTASLKYIFGNKLQDETTKSQIVQHIKELISDEYLSLKEKEIFISRKAISHFYIL